MERLIKRYQNRKMYDTQEKKYVNLKDIEEMIRSNEELKIIDNVSGEDITRQILIQLVMRTDPVESEKKLPLEGLKDFIQSKDSPFAQAFRGMMNLGRDLMKPVGESGAQLGAVTDVVRKVSDAVSEKAVKVVNGSLARQMLNVPTRDDWQRIEEKFHSLEKKLMELEKDGGKNHD